MNLFDLTGQVAVITGSSRGIGRAMAERLAQHGATVVISSRKQVICDSVAGEINANFGAGRALAVAASLSDKAALRALVERTLATFGRIDTLICNAATNPYFGPMGGIDDDQFRKILENNVMANHWLTSSVAPQMVERRSGSIIIVSSVSGLRGSANLGAYGMSKAADLQLVRNLAVELGPHNVRVNAIAPGVVRTAFARALWQDPQALARSEGSAALRRIGEPDDLAGAAVFLAAPASRFITGQTLVVDGGATV